METAIEISGSSLKYFEKGNGEPLVFVHGSASDYRSWQSQQDEFARHFRVITYSRRFHWPNQPIPDGVDYSMPEQVDDLQTLVRSLDATPAHLVGHSYGAFLSLLLAMRQPDYVRTLVLAEPPAITLFVSNNPKPLEILKLLVSRPRTAAAIIKFGAKGVTPAIKAFKNGDMERGVRKFGEAVFGRGSFDRLPANRKEQIHSNLPNMRAELLGSGFASLDEDQIRSIRIPTLLVNGQLSIGLFHCLTDRLEELLPNTERIEIGKASHAMHMDNVTDFNQAVLSFLLKHK